MQEQVTLPRLTKAHYLYEDLGETCLMTTSSEYLIAILESIWNRSGDWRSGFEVMLLASGLLNDPIEKSLYQQKEHLQT